MRCELKRIKKVRTTQKRLLNVPGYPEPADVYSLTVRERQVLRRLCLGWSAEQIGLALGITEVTVRGYEYGMRRELGLADRGGLMVWGLQNPDAARTGSCVTRTHGEDCQCGYCGLTGGKEAA